MGKNQRSSGKERRKAFLRKIKEIKRKQGGGSRKQDE